MFKGSNRGRDNTLNLNNSSAVILFNRNSDFNPKRGKTLYFLDSDIFNTLSAKYFLGVTFRFVIILIFFTTIYN